MKTRKKVLIGLVITFVILSIAGWFGWQKLHYPPAAEAVSAVENAEDKGDFFYFPGEEEKPLVIFYPGALVDAESYSVWASALADEGYAVAIVKMPFDLAVLGGNRAVKVLADAPQTTYVIGGHSLGGVMASRFAANESDGVEQKLAGVFYFASYPDEKGSLADRDLPVLSLIGSRDQIVNHDNWQSAKDYLPDTAVFKEIELGTHAGFGTYGEQRGEEPTDLTNSEQQQIIADTMAEWLSSLSK
ncbi:alpha/beta hydrolase [Enterococcus sp. DIV0876]|uniref:alpha/beta hydrolase n=1 Tax=Enterococcus sp. DIV0876 TaxID=2774633 RepID=UPI003D2FC852